MADQLPKPRRTWPVKAGCAVLGLALILAVGVTIAIPVIRGRQRRQAAIQLDRSGGAVVYRHQFSDAPPRSAWSVFAEDLLGMDVEPAVHISNPSGGWTESQLLLLRYFPEVDGMDLGPSELSGRVLERLSQLKNLRTISLGGRASRASLANLKQFAALEQLSLAADLDEEAWQSIAGLQGLKSLDLSGSKALAPAPVWFQSPQCRVSEVSMVGGEANDALLNALGAWQSLQVVRVNRITVDDRAVEAINSLPNLQFLEIYWSKVPKEFSPAMFRGRNLENVTLSACQMHRDAFDRCYSWQGRPKIDLSGSEVVE